MGRARGPRGRLRGRAHAADPERVLPRNEGRRRRQSSSAAKRERMNYAASSRVALQPVVQLNKTIIEALNRVQLQWHVTVTSCYQRNPISNEHGDYTHDEFVDRSIVEKGGDEITAPHQPDVLARLLSKTPHEW